mmetsp:Transcript_15852/g.31861  ORF Transcript_15852/g.31861 Transcript_15852/m.31861 type:complete len:86 (-) Transcript_15852:8-265(-)
MEMRVGEVLQFYGHQCDHFSLPNTTSVTRLSLDFRVVPRSRFLERYEGSHTGSGAPRFGLDGFFDALDPVPDLVAQLAGVTVSSE